MAKRNGAAAKRFTWTAKDNRQLRSMARQGLTAGQAAKGLKRSTAAVYQYASKNKISFGRR